MKLLDVYDKLEFKFESVNCNIILIMLLLRIYSANSGYFCHGDCRVMSFFMVSFIHQQNQPETLVAWDNFVYDLSNGTVSCIITESGPVAVVVDAGNDKETSTAVDDPPPGLVCRNFTVKYSNNLSRLFI